MKKILKQNKGLASSDALIAIMIIALFTGLIATILYNIYISNSSLKRMSMATNYVVDILEYSDKLYFDDLTTSSKMKQKFDYLEDAENIGVAEEQDVERIWKIEGTIDKGYDVTVTLDKYKPDQNAFDLVKKITVTVSYKVGNRNQDVSIYKIKSRESFDIPNKPDLSLLTVQEGDIVYKIREESENYIVCDENDENWYKYDLEDPDSSITAKVIITDEKLEIGDTISSEDYTILQWVPRFIEDQEENKTFLYSNTNSYIEENAQGIQILVDSNLDATQAFGTNTGIWEQI